MKRSFGNETFQDNILFSNQIASFNLEKTGTVKINYQVKMRQTAVLNQGIPAMNVKNVGKIIMMI